MTVAYPLQWPDGWPVTPRHRQRNSRFKVTPDRARRNLLDQVRMLGGTHTVISSDLAVRQDGQPYADQARRRIHNPGVAIYFMLGGKQMAMACDIYLTPHENMHSLGHAIEHMRGLDRHGGGHMVEKAFRGFTALPSSGPTWWQVLGVSQTATADEIRAAYRSKAAAAHPDRGGSTAAMAELNVARDDGLKAAMERA